MSSIFGGSKSKQQAQNTSSSTQSSSSDNQAYGTIDDVYRPQAQSGVSAFDRIKALLGLGGNKAEADEGYGQYLGSTDYDYTNREGRQAVTGSAAMRGMLGSGATAKALTQFGQNNQQKYFGDYIAKLLGLSGQGMDAGRMLAGAGQRSSSTGMSTAQGTSSGSSSSSEGIAKTIGSFASLAAASDRRLKTDIKKVGEESDGLGVYEWTYKWGGSRFRGYMADEVSDIRPWMVGPSVDGFATVNYEVK